MAIKIFGQTEQKTQDVYLKLTANNEEVMLDVVTKTGNWERTLLYITTKGLILCTGADGVGFPVTKQSRIKIIKE